MQTVIDAQSRKLGRVATEAAKALMGKELPGFRKNKVSNVTVKIINAGKADISTRRLEQLNYTRYTGYPGGLRVESGTHLKARKGISEIFSIAIEGMLPDNKLKTLLMKKLTIVE